MRRDPRRFRGRDCRPCDSHLCRQGCLQRGGLCQRSGLRPERGLRRLHRRDQPRAAQGRRRDMDPHGPLRASYGLRHAWRDQRSGGGQDRRSAQDRSVCDSVHRRAAGRPRGRHHHDRLRGAAGARDGRTGGGGLGQGGGGLRAGVGHRHWQGGHPRAGRGDALADPRPHRLQCVSRSRPGCAHHLRRLCEGWELQGAHCVFQHRRLPRGRRVTPARLREHHEVHRLRRQPTPYTPERNKFLKLFFPAYCTCARTSTQDSFEPNRLLNSCAL
mmetsp:Transcript_29263/g.64939  ORF Transcript_29263/g.64939 Transcript_29263/m.64939 type:complete len:272 (+) Transcript_29263:178-993(+)